MVATRIKMVKHSMLCVYLRYITNTIFEILFVNVSRMSICFFFFPANRKGHVKQAEEQFDNEIQLFSQNEGKDKQKGQKIY